MSEVQCSNCQHALKVDAADLRLRCEIDGPPKIACPSCLSQIVVASVDGKLVHATEPPATEQIK